MRDELFNQVRNKLKELKKGELLKVQSLDKGSESKNYLIETTKAQFIFKTYKRRDREEVTYESSILDELGQLGLLYCPKQASELFLFEDKPALIFEFIEGNTLNIEDITIERVNQIAKSLAKIHIALRGFMPKGKKIRLGTFDFSFEKYPLSDNLEYHKKRLQEEIISLKNELEQYKNIILSKSVVHDDLSPDNIILSSKGELFFIDFDEAHRGDIISDVAISIKELIIGTVGINPNLIRAFIKSYSEINSLDSSELELLPLLIRRRNLFMFAYWMGRLSKGERETEMRIDKEYKLLNLLSENKALIRDIIMI